MKTIASMAILFSFAGTALAQESVSPYRLGSWVPRDTNSCDTIYGDGRQLCLADRYHIQQDDKASEQQGSLQRAQERSEEHTSELQSQSNLVCRLLLEKKKKHSRCNATDSRLTARRS